MSNNKDKRVNNIYDRFKLIKFSGSISKQDS